MPRVTISVDISVPEGYAAFQIAAAVEEGVNAVLPCDCYVLTVKQGDSYAAGRDLYIVR